jgi:pimeloyl-ACP methyl ester carboxylesterase
MISEAIDGLVPSLMKYHTLNGPASRSRDGIRFLDLGLATIRYRKVGNGKQVIVFETDPPIVIEHYDYLIACLKQDFTVVVFEPPGFGFSIPSMQLDYRYATLVGLTEAFLDALNLGPVTFVAPCVLGYGGMGLAQKRPDLIRHLVLSQVPSWEEMLKWKAGRDPNGLLSLPVFSQLLLKVLKRKRTPVWFERALGDKHQVDAFNQIAQQAFAQGASFNLASGFQRLLVGDSPLPKHLSQEALFLWGDADSSHCDTCKQSSIRMMPNAHAVHIESAGHFPELEAPDTVIDHITQFIASSPVTGSR